MTENQQLKKNKKQNDLRIDSKFCLGIKKRKCEWKSRFGNVGNLWKISAGKIYKQEESSIEIGRECVCVCMCRGVEERGGSP